MGVLVLASIAVGFVIVVVVLRGLMRGFFSLRGAVLRMLFSMAGLTIGSTITAHVMAAISGK
ncbi:MAG: hypothetical protein ACYCZN_01580 [Candidatus Dormibacteria bacterium]